MRRVYRTVEELKVARRSSPARWRGSDALATGVSPLQLSSRKARMPVPRGGGGRHFLRQGKQAQSEGRVRVSLPRVGRGT
jgi:hypothetical protein